MCGTFDPFHNGHLNMALMSYFGVKNSKIVIVPYYDPPHKNKENIASYEDRCKMVKVAIENYEPYIMLSKIDEMINYKKSPSYIVEILRRIRIEEETNQIGLLIGEDYLENIEKFKNAEEILLYNKILVASRNGGHLLSFGMSNSITNTISNSDILNYYRNNIEVVKMKKCNNTISEDIKSKISNNNYDVDVPKSVIEYIKTKKIY